MRICILKTFATLITLTIVLSSTASAQVKKRINGTANGLYTLTISGTIINTNTNGTKTQTIRPDTQFQSPLRDDQRLVRYWFDKKENEYLEAFLSYVLCQAHGRQPCDLSLFVENDICFSYIDRYLNGRSYEWQMKSIVSDQENRVTQEPFPRDP